jgi:hypothetical protein
MPPNNTMRFVVDAEQSSAVHSALPLPHLSSLAAQSVEISREAVCKACSSTVQDVMDVLSSLPKSKNAAKITEVKFTLMLNAGGEVSIMSLAKGHLSGATGFEFTIRFED